MASLLGWLGRRPFVLAVVSQIPFLLALAGFGVWASVPEISGPVTQPPITPGPHTTVITEPLRPDGTLDFARAINERDSHGVTLQNNAAVPLLLALWKFPDVKLRLNELGLATIAGDVPFFVPFESLMIAFKRIEGLTPAESQEWAEELERSLPIARNAPWTDEKLPLLVSWLDSNAGVIPQIVEGFDRDRYFVPLAPKNQRALGYRMNPYVQLMVLDLLHVRVTYLIGYDQDQKALEAVGNLRRWAAHQNASAIKHRGFDVMARSIHKRASRLEAILIKRGRLTAEDWENHRKQIQEFPAFRPIWKLIDSGDRFVLLNSWEWVRWELNTSVENQAIELGQVFDETEVRISDVSPVFDSPRISGDWFPWMVHRHPIMADRMAIRLNDHFDSLVEALKQPTREGLVRAFDELNREASQLREDYLQMRSFTRFLMTTSTPLLSDSMADWQFVEEYLQRLPELRDWDDETRTLAQIADTAFAIAMYRADRGEYPKKLVELVPDYLDERPVDVFAEKPGTPLIYEKRSDGFRLRSVGSRRDIESLTFPEARDFSTSPPDLSFAVGEQ